MTEERHFKELVELVRDDLRQFRTELREDWRALVVRVDRLEDEVAAAAGDRRARQELRGQIVGIAGVVATVVAGAVGAVVALVTR